MRRFLRQPLHRKIVVGNALLVAAVATLAALLVWHGTDVPGGELSPGAVTAVALGVVLLLAAAQALVARLALSAMAPLEATARAVESGDLSARCTPSPLADNDLLRLSRVFNGMLDTVESARARQRELAARVLRAEERERLWLARELLDDTAQVLAASLLHLRSVGASTPDPDSVASARERIVEAIDGVRKLARRLRPPELDELGLAAAIESHARTLGDASGVSIECSTGQVDRSLGQETRLILYRIVREALDNAVRHSGAGRICVTLTERAGRVVAEVRDDGVGFDPDAVVRTDGDGFGLAEIERRTAFLGGRMELDSGAGRGTVVRVEVPSGADAVVADVKGQPSSRGDTATAGL